jgi:phosphohistidine phosphatase
MPRLHVLRHAKSSWDDPALADAARPLAPRGRRAAARLAAHVREAGIRPELVLCSSAARARQTLALLAEALGDPDVVVEEGLYEASSGDLVARLRTLPAEVGEALLVGHNPALQGLVLRLARPGPLRERVEGKLPTGALASLVLDASWRDLADGGATLEALALPRELPDPPR